jgi:hypothetical protein
MASFIACFDIAMSDLLLLVIWNIRIPHLGGEYNQTIEK